MLLHGNITDIESAEIKTHCEEMRRESKRGEKFGMKSMNEEGQCVKRKGQNQELRTACKERRKMGQAKEEKRNRHAEKALPGGLIPMCCWPSMTKPPIGWPSGL